MSRRSLQNSVPFSRIMRSRLTRIPMTLLAIAVLSGGSVLSGQVAASPTSISWSTVAVSNAGGQKVAMLTNPSNSTITVNSIGFTGTNAGDFQIFSKTCGSTLAASASCTANIIFKPNASGTRTATLNFIDTAGNSPQTVSVSGTGSAAPTSISATPTSISWSTVAVGNAGGKRSLRSPIQVTARSPSAASVSQERTPATSRSLARHAAQLWLPRPVAQPTSSSSPLHRAPAQRR